MSLTLADILAAAAGGDQRRTVGCGASRMGAAVYGGGHAAPV